MKHKTLELLIALPAVIALGYHAGMYLVNVATIGVLPYLLKYLVTNNPFKDGEDRTEI